MKVHETEIKKYSGNLKELAKDIVDLRYDALAEFINELNKNILECSIKDEQKGYMALSIKLKLISNDLNFIYNQFLGAWNICKKYMPEKIKVDYYNNK